MNTGVDGSPKPITPLLQIVDEPTTFWFDGKAYEPGNYKNEIHGLVTLRQALAKSMNIPTVKIAEMVGFDKVAALAKQAGLNSDIKATPAVALGAYEVTPIEMAGAYTMFANQGMQTKPSYIKFIRDASGHAIYENKPVHKQVLDPRVTFMMVDLLEEVLRTGTGATVRSRGFTLPAAGKTGTSHDGWFAGFTSNLICVVWVGFDNNSELNLEGAKSALPIWTEFMKRAHIFREYRAAREFPAPEGIVSVEVDPATGRLASAGCPGIRSEMFIAGTQPTEVCTLHGGGATHVAGWETTPPVATAEGASTAAAATVEKIPPGALPRRGRPAETVLIQPPSTPAEAEKPKEKKGFFDRIKGLFK
jgi:penicillin-binding protein 1B